MTITMHCRHVPAVTHTLPLYWTLLKLHGLLISCKLPFLKSRPWPHPTSPPPLTLNSIYLSSLTREWVQGSSRLRSRLGINNLGCLSHLFHIIPLSLRNLLAYAALVNTEAGLCLLLRDNNNDEYWIGLDCSTSQTQWANNDPVAPYTNWLGTTTCSSNYAATMIGSNGGKWTIDKTTNKNFVICKQTDRKY